MLSYSMDLAPWRTHRPARGSGGSHQTSKGDRDEGPHESSFQFTTDLSFPDSRVRIGARRAATWSPPSGLPGLCSGGLSRFSDRAPGLANPDPKDDRLGSRGGALQGFDLPSPATTTPERQ